MAKWRSAVGRRAPGRAGIDREILTGAPGWLWPYWAERQLDPGSASYIPFGPLAALPNVTGRNWTVVGNLGSPWLGSVDPRGLVTPCVGGWSLDWWIGAEDRWHLPSREAAVRQTLAGSTPVVETAMRIPGGDAVQRVYAVPAFAPDHSGELLVVEVENQSPVPVAVAFAVRPYNPVGSAPIGRIEQDGATVLVDDRPALLLPRPPAGAAGSALGTGDCLVQVVAGQAAPGAVDLEDVDGFGQAAFVYPLPHRSTVRVAMPLTLERPRGSGGGPRKAGRKAVPPAVDATRWPASTDVMRGWQAHLRRGLRLELPDSRLQAAVDANRAALLLFHTGQGIVPAPWGGEPSSFLESASLVVTLDRFGFHAEAAEVLRAQPWRSIGDGGRTHNREAPAGALWAIAEHQRLTGDTALLGDLIPAVRDGVRVLAGHRVTASLPYEDGFWIVRGLADGAWLLRLAGDTTAADSADGAAAQLRQAISASLDHVAARLGRVAMPAAPQRNFDAGMIGALVACAPLGLLPPDDPWVAGTLDVVRERFCVGEAFYDALGHTGLAPSLTLRIARCELEAGDPKAWRRLRWMLDVATPTFAWAEAIHPRLGGGSQGDGHHGGSAAAFLAFLRQAMIRETPAGAVALLTTFPPEWAGHPLEVHEAPTHFGRMSYAVRWHDDRPALLWQCERPGVTLTVPGLDRSFSTTEQSGEALLAPYRARVPIPLRDASQS
ncbi:MAG TPA: hypothetical protein VEG38_14085 [Acidimicrobiia bacterium]|nr:hypothetical protein [Acidimicrobiia bacterium]